MMRPVLALLSGLLLAFAWWRFWFFHRHPSRAIVPGADPVSPADGRILYVDEVELRPDAPDPYHRRVQAAFGLEGRWTLMATYLSIFDVHVVRAPLAGTVRLHHLEPLGGNASMGGSFLLAACRRPLPLGKRGYTHKNEFLGVEITGATRLLLVLMADWWIDQIVAWVDDGARVQRGQAIGKIQMGSQVDLWWPQGQMTPLHQAGARVSAGDTRIASLSCSPAGPSPTVPQARSQPAAAVTPRSQRSAPPARRHRC